MMYGAYSLYTAYRLHLADPVKARGCSTNTVVIRPVGRKEGRKNDALGESGD